MHRGTCSVVVAIIHVRITRVDIRASPGIRLVVVMESECW